jgi:hypothetical protein
MRHDTRTAVVFPPEPPGSHIKHRQRQIVIGHMLPQTGAFDVGQPHGWPHVLPTQRRDPHMGHAVAVEFGLPLNQTILRQLPRPPGPALPTLHGWTLP